MSDKVAAALTKLDAIVAELRMEARDGTDEGEDMSVVRGWANDISRQVRTIREALKETP